MTEKKKQTDPIQSQLRKLARAYLHKNGCDLAALATAIRDLGVYTPREVKLLIDAIKADVLQDLVTPPSAELRGLVLERLASRILSESDATHDEARWAVDIWAQSFGSSAAVQDSQPSPKPALSWDDEEQAAQPSLNDLRAGAPAVSAGTSAPEVTVVPNTAPPRFVPQPTPVRHAEPVIADYEIGSLASKRAWKHWIVVAVVILLLVAGLICAIALPSIIGSPTHSSTPAQSAQP